MFLCYSYHLFRMYQAPFVMRLRLDCQTVDTILIKGFLIFWLKRIENSGESKVRHIRYAENL